MLLLDNGLAPIYFYDFISNFLCTQVADHCFQFNWISFISLSRYKIEYRYQYRILSRRPASKAKPVVTIIPTKCQYFTNGERVLLRFHINGIAQRTEMRIFLQLFFFAFHPLCTHIVESGMRKSENVNYFRTS